MTHVIAEPCIGTKDTACVQACPVDCIHPYSGGPKGSFDAEPQLYIDPAECIDCAACVPACPVEAIFAEADLPSKWQKYTQINVDWFANLGTQPAPAGAPAAAAAAAPRKKAAAPAPEPPPKPLELSPEEMYKPLSVLRQDVAANRGAAPAEDGARRSPALIFLAAAVVLLAVYGISNNFSKVVNTTLYGQLAALAVGDQKPTLTGNVYTLRREIDGQRYLIKVSDSIFGGRTLNLQVPAKPFESIYHEDEKFFAAVTNQESRYYYVFVDENSDGKLDSALQVRELWSAQNRFLGRYHKPVPATPELQALYAEAARTLAQRLGLTKGGT